MDAEIARAYLLALPHVEETMQWGENLVFWVGDKAIGGKMFTLINLDAGDGPVIAFAAAPEHAAELREKEGLIPAPYFARIGWIAALRWNVLSSRDWREELAAAHAQVLANLPPRTLALLTLPEAERSTLVRERRQLLAAKATAKAAAKTPAKSKPVKKPASRR